MGRMNVPDFIARLIKVSPLKFSGCFVAYSCFVIFEAEIGDGESADIWRRTTPPATLKIRRFPKPGSRSCDRLADKILPKWKISLLGSTLVSTSPRIRRLSKWLPMDSIRCAFTLSIGDSTDSPNWKTKPIHEHIANRCRVRGIQPKSSLHPTPPFAAFAKYEPVTFSKRARRLTRITKKGR